MYLVIALLLSLSAAYFTESQNLCSTVYFLNSVLIVNSSFSGSIYLETPINLSTRDLNQTVLEVLTRGAVLNRVGTYYINVSPESPAYAYIFLEIRTCSKSYGSGLDLLRKVLSTPATATIEYGTSYEDIPAEFVGSPPEIVVSVVRRDFEEWLRSYDLYVLVGNISNYPLLVSAFAAKFIYGGVYLKYSASLLPRTLEQVIGSREGDCDDMSRILVSLLWSYGIPAVIAYGYTVLPGFSMTSTVGSFEYVFSEGGPHAFVLAYIPGYGWLSLDFLAGSLLTQPFVFWGLTSNINVTEQDIEEIEEFHSKISGRQFTAVFMPGDRILEERETLERFLNISLGIDTGVTQPPEPTETPTTPIETAITTPTTQVSPDSREYAVPVLMAIMAILLSTALAVRLLKSKLKRA